MTNRTAFWGLLIALLLFSSVWQLAYSQAGNSGSVNYITDSDPCFRPFPFPFACCGGGGQDIFNVTDPPNLAIIQRLEGFPGQVSSARFSPNEKRMATVNRGTDFGPEVRLWNLESTQLLNTWSGGYDYPAFSPDGQRLAMVTSQGSIEIWNVEEKTKVSSIKTPRNTEGDYEEPSYFARGLAFSPDGKIIAVIRPSLVESFWPSLDGDYDKYEDFVSVELFNVNTGRMIRRLVGKITDQLVEGEMRHGVINGHADLIEGIAFSPSGQVLASSSADGTLRLWDASTGRHLHCFAFDPYIFQFSRGVKVSFSSDGLRVANNNGTREIYVWNAVNGNQLYKLDILHSGLAFSQDLRSVLIGDDYNGPVTRWSLESGELTGVLVSGVGKFSPGEFSPSARLIAEIANNRPDGSEVIIWNAAHPDLRKAVPAEQLIRRSRELVYKRDQQGIINLLIDAQKLNTSKDYDLRVLGGLRIISVFNLSGFEPEATESIATFVYQIDPNALSDQALAYYGIDPQTTFFNEETNSHSDGEMIKTVLSTWDAVHRSSISSLQFDGVESVLSGAALEQHRTSINNLKNGKCSWVVDVLTEPQLVSLDFNTPTQAVAKVLKNWDMDLVCNDQRDEKSGSDGQFLAVYTLQREADGWRIVKKESQEYP